MAIASIKTSGQDQWAMARTAFMGQLSTQNPAVNVPACCWYENNHCRWGATSIWLLTATEIISHALKCIDEGVFSNGLTMEMCCCYLQPLQPLPSHSIRPSTNTHQKTEAKETCSFIRKQIWSLPTPLFILIIGLYTGIHDNQCFKPSKGRKDHLNQSWLKF